jgi:hypothetical protein
MNCHILLMLLMGSLMCGPAYSDEGVALTPQPIQINAAVKLWVNDAGTIVVEVDRHNPLASRGDGAVDEVFFLQRDRDAFRDGLDEHLRLTLPSAHIVVSNSHFALTTTDGEFGMEAGLDASTPEGTFGVAEAQSTVKPLHFLEPRVVGIGRGRPEYVQALSLESCNCDPCDSGGPGSSSCGVSGCYSMPTQCSVTCSSNYFACCLCTGGGLGKACCGCRRNGPG